MLTTPHKADLVQLMAHQTLIELSKESEENPTKEPLPIVQLKATVPTPMSASTFSGKSLISQSVLEWLVSNWILLIGLAALMGGVFYWGWTNIMSKKPKNSEPLPAFKEDVSTGAHPIGRPLN